MSTHEAALTGAFPRARAARPREAVVAFWGLMVFTFVLFVAPQNMIPALGVLAPARTPVAIALLAYLINRAQTGQSLTTMTPTVRWVLAVVLAAVLSIPTSYWPGGSVTTFVDLFGKSLVIFFVIANVIRTEARAKLLIESMLAWGTIAAIVTIKNYASGNLELQGIRVAGYDSPLAHNPNDLALTLNILLGLAIGLHGTLHTRRSRFLLFAVMGVMAAGVVASFSRSGFITLAVLLAFWAVRSIRQRGVRVLFLLAPIVLVAWMLLPSDYSERLSTIGDMQADTTGSSEERWETMKFAMHLIAEYPAFGVGLGNNVHVSVDRKGPVMDAHNAYLKLGAELGVLGMIAYVGLIVSAISCAALAHRRLRRHSETRALACLARGVQLALIAFAVGAFFSPVPYHFYFFYPAGLAVALDVMSRRAAAQHAGAR
jgi:O-antigen ligase